MADLINDTPMVDIAIWRGAPTPIVFNETVDGVQVIYDTSIRMEVTGPEGSLFALTTGDEITLSTYAGISNAQVSIQLSETQSLMLEMGKRYTYKITTGPTGSHHIYLAGKIVVQGG